MDVKKTLRIMARVIALAIFLLAGKFIFDWSRPKDARPNIILILTDDQDAASLASMPQLAKLSASRGVTFTNGFVASPVCIPSRASILRGQYLNNHGVFNRSAEFSERGHERQTMATMLHDAGYRTGLVGKYFNGNLKPATPPPGWDDWHAILTDNVYYNYQLNENGRTVSYGNEKQDYISDVISKKSVDFISQKGQKQPFFLFINTVAPHVPVTPPPGHEHDFADLAISFSFEQDTSDKPEWLRRYYGANAATTAIPYFDFNDADTAKAAEWRRSRLRTLVAVDRMVEQLVAGLTAAGEIDNTYIFYLSDNGDDISPHLQTSAKLLPYEEGIRVPFLAAGPGLPAGATLPHLVSAIDLLPTFAELAGVARPDFTDGRSLVPLLRQNPPPPDEWRQQLAAELGQVTDWPWQSTPPAYRLLRGRNFKYIEYDTGEREYYDLDTDPREERNIYPELESGKKEQLANSLREELAGNNDKKPAQARTNQR